MASNIKETIYQLFKVTALSVKNNRVDDKCFGMKLLKEGSSEEVNESFIKYSRKGMGVIIKNKSTIKEVANDDEFDPYTPSCA